MAVGMRIGELLVQLGYVSQEDVDAALEAQQHTGQRLGEILIERGKLSKFALTSALSAQWEMRQARAVEPALAPEQSDGSTGKMLCEVVDLESVLVIVEEDPASAGTAAAETRFDGFGETAVLAQELFARLESRIVELGARQTSESRTYEDALQQLRERVDQQRAELLAQQAEREALKTASTQNTLENIGLKLGLQLQLDQLAAGLNELWQQIQALTDREPTNGYETAPKKKQKKYKQRMARR